MGAYILRRFLLIIPTLLGIMLINFILTQFVPGGPIDQVIARIGGGGDSIRAISGGGDSSGETDQLGGKDSNYLGARGLTPEFLDELEVQFGFARFICEEGFSGKPSTKASECTKEAISTVERFWVMMKNYIQLDFGQSYFRSIGVIDLMLEKLPVSISLGLWSTLIAYAVSIPLGIRKAVQEGSKFDTWTSGIIISAYAIPSFLFAVMLLIVFAGGSYFRWFPLRGLTSDNWGDLSLIGKVYDYLWHITLPVLALVMSSFATLTLLTKNSFLEELKKQYVMTARAKGLTEYRVLYGHVFRNAMLIVIAGFPALFISIFFTGSLLIEMIFSLDGMGQLFYRAAIERDYPVIFGTLYLFSLMGLVISIISDLMYIWIDPRIDFEKRG